MNTASDTSEKKDYITREDWADDVRNALNALIADNGKEAKLQDGTSYAVFDFDNTTAIMDSEEITAAYQLEHMAFALSPGELKTVLLSGIGDPCKDRSHRGYGKGSYNDWIADICASYEDLYGKYGPFTPPGLDEEKAEKVREDPSWKEFSVKIRVLYDLIYAEESGEVAFPWITYWFTGMTEEEVYHLAYAAFAMYKSADTHKKTWESPKDRKSLVGEVSRDITYGICVSENIRELMRAFSQNGIKVWICSASDLSVIRAAVDAFGLHDYVTGVLALTDRIADGTYESACDPERHGKMTLPGGKWEEDTFSEGATPQGNGKAAVIQNTLCRRYGHGPLAGFMDSTGDFDFCTVFRTLKLVVCFNRGDRGVTDGGGLIAELALYQKENLHYDYESAQSAGDTLYLLQGIDENGKRTFRNSDRSLLFGKTGEVLLATGENRRSLAYMKEHSMSTKDIVNTFCLRRSEEDKENLLGFSYGFTERFAGYHTHE